MNVVHICVETNPQDCTCSVFLVGIFTDDVAMTSCIKKAKAKYVDKRQHIQINPIELNKGYLVD